MIELKDAPTIVGKPINGISLNGLEYLLNEDSSDYMSFKDRETAKTFLKENGYDSLTDDELEDSFIFKTIFYQTICDDHHGSDEVDEFFATKAEAKERFNLLKKDCGYCRYEEIEIVGYDEGNDEYILDNNDTVDSFYAEDEEEAEDGTK